MSVTTDQPRVLRSALLVDFDNVYIGLKRLDPAAAEAFATNPGHWLAELEQGADTDGEVTRRFLVRACYLNPSVYSRYRPNFTRAGFRVVDCPSLTQQGKSSADINLVLDAVDALAAPTRYDEFVIVSADADFTPLAQRCRADDRRVTIITASPAASAYRAVADGVVGADALADLVTQTASALDVDDAAPAEAGGVPAQRAAAPDETEPAVPAPTPVAADATSAGPDAAGAATRPAPEAAPEATSGATPAAESRARRAVRRHVRTADRPVPMGAVAQVAQTADPTLSSTQWRGAGGFTAWLARSLPDLAVSTRPPGHVWDPRRFGEADLPGAVADTDPTELQKQVIAVTDTPGLSQEQYRVLLEQLASDLGQHPFERVGTSRRVHEACQQAGAKVGRSTVNFVISGVLYTGLSLTEPRRAGELASAWADNVIGLGRGARMELTGGDVHAIRSWVGGGLVEG